MSDEQRWSIGLSPWIIQDGNYGDFAVGDVRRFAVEFYAKDGLALMSDRRRSYEPRGGEFYTINAEVIHVSQQWWALDFGALRIFEERNPPANVYTGDFVAGQVWLGIDPFFYFERLCKATGAPEMVYEWEICGIESETAPLIQHPSGTFRIPDETRKVRTKIQRTDAWTEGRGEDDWLEYSLQCRLRGGPFTAAKPGSAP